MIHLIAADHCYPPAAGHRHLTAAGHHHLNAAGHRHFLLRITVTYML